MTRPDSYFPTAAAWVSAVRQMAERPSQIWEIFRFSQNLVRANNDLAIEAHVHWSYIGVPYEIRPRLVEQLRSSDSHAFVGSALGRRRGSIGRAVRPKAKGVTTAYWT
jgi:hypothetical protein